MDAGSVPLISRWFGPQSVRGLQPHRRHRCRLLIAWGLLELHLGGITVLIAIAVLQVAAELLIGRNHGVALVAVTPPTLLMVSTAALIEPLLADRAAETLIGATIAMLVGWIAHRVLRTRSPSRITDSSTGHTIGESMDIPDHT